MAPRDQHGKQSCPVCHTTFSSRTSLKAHMVSRHNGKKEACPECSALFPDKTNVNRHRRSAHPRDAAARMSWFCVECKRCFGQRSDNARRHAEKRSGCKVERLTDGEASARGLSVSPAGTTPPTSTSGTSTPPDAPPLPAAAAPAAADAVLFDYPPISLPLEFSLDPALDTALASIFAEQEATNVGYMPANLVATQVAEQEQHELELKQEPEFDLHTVAAWNQYGDSQVQFPPPLDPTLPVWNGFEDDYDYNYMKNLSVLDSSEWFADDPITTPYDMLYEASL